MIPIHVTLRSIQYIFGTEVKSATTAPMVAFFALGVTQGWVYGDLAKRWTRALNLSRHPANAMRGAMFGGLRDVVSQGIPFMAGQYGMGALLASSLASTYASQGLHNAQTIMQVRPDLSYSGAISELARTHGWHSLYRGVASRLFLMTVTNILNHVFLRKVWAAHDDVEEL